MEIIIIDISIMLAIVVACGISWIITYYLGKLNLSFFCSMLILVPTSFLVGQLVAYAGFFYVWPVIAYYLLPSVS